MCSRACLDAVEKREFHGPDGNRTRFLGGARALITALILCMLILSPVAVYLIIVSKGMGYYISFTEYLPDELI
jgi:hypothetical protein